ncbi:hypothetical protein WL98_06055 [Burkholderia multivorans]|nr:hypothetical protein WL98_06055 [Burkholderia multivorans]PRE21050.1 hypothetical protein C6P78_01125 [Burkholderia multivorans]
MWQFLHSQIAFVMSERSPSDICASYLADPGRAPKMCAASPRLIADASTLEGPLVSAMQSGLEQVFAARFTSVSTVACLNLSDPRV